MSRTPIVDMIRGMPENERGRLASRKYPISMSVLLQLREALKSYGSQMLLDETSVVLYEDQKVGFVGRNGTGKSTLLRCLIGEEELDRGEIIRSSKLRIGYLRQHDPFEPGESALNFLMRDSGQPDWKCGAVAGQFELKGQYLEGPVAALSGGWQTRVKLAALLLHEPNLLLLDEPTNFLDLRTQLLLEHFLKNFREACLIVSHDRAFLAATCDHTLNLSRGKLTMYPGKVEAYLEFEAEQRERAERENETIAAKQRQLQTFIDKNKARASTATRAKSKSKQLERLQLNEIGVAEAAATIRCPVIEPRTGAAVRCKNLSIGYPDRTVATGIDLEIVHGQRVAIVGDNGQGKTTFLRTLVDSLPPLKGEVRWGHNCNIGVYAQHVYTSLPPTRTVMNYLEDQADFGITTQAILNLAGAMLFRGDAVDKKVSVLSGGERARLCMAGLLLGKHNILVLDEPGNHLDVDTLEALAEALIDYKGTVIFTSHDRHFMRRVATCVIEARDGRVVNYNGDYDSYVYAINKQIDDSEREERVRQPKAAATNLKSTSTSTAKVPVKNEREIRKQLGNIERAIAKAEQQKKVVNDQLMATTDAIEALRRHDELQAICAEISSAEEHWLELTAQLEAGTNECE